ncbi:hypothetical protein CLOSTMETH_01622 [[Clostridium] methylpentosum DSM 5476]|uniref:Uncharacterized protein n=1 Tax=[Clostridium] methylpentosum DSM 5476 TaxID=537013 RepID=C0ECQ1_9FIRM|nr:hypothetical protein CLOSTMETH_01622 [[Clostridium] methylpentosum DSM 5476]
MAPPKGTRRAAYSAAQKPLSIELFRKNRHCKEITFEIGEDY